MRITRCVVFVTLIVFVGGTMCAGDPPPSIQRVRGVIDHDQTWSGQVLLTGDVTIDGATVTVAAGTTIEFAEGFPNVHPTLTIGAPVHRGGRLDLQSTAERPITIRTHEGTNAGRIIVYVRGERPSITAPNVPAEIPGKAGSALNWRHVRFEDLGYVVPSAAVKGRFNRVEPALKVHILESDTTLEVSNCVFEKTGSLRIDAGAKARIMVMSNQFTAPKDRVAIDLSVDALANDTGTAQISANRATAAIRIRAPAAQISRNLLIGVDACVIAEDGPAGNLRITDNYIHNTTRDDDGRYGLNCERPDALIDGNIIRGGTTCVLSGSRRFSNNVLIAQPVLASRVVRHAQTHQLVAALPAGAIFEQNLLIGPAYSMLIPQMMPAPSAASPNAPTLIRNNTFDGLDESTRAIHVNPVDRAAATIRIENNLFLRISALVYDETRSGRTVLYADYNAAAPVPRRAFDQTIVAGLKEGQEGWAGHDLRFKNIGEMRLTAIPQHPADFDADLQSGRLTIAAIREKLFAAYRPLPDSPLIGAGRADSGEASATRPSIGAFGAGSSLPTK
jgi:hypothetical protein